jgi:sugar phosphate isomerase/epimerase
MKINQVAIQLYTLRNHCKTPADFASTIKRVRDIGYQSVQISGVCAMPESETVAILKGEGVTCCATHESSDTILDQPQVIAERLSKLGCKITAYPYPRNVKFDTLEDVRAFAGKLNAAGKVLHEAGQVLCYHNHQIEFRRVAGKLVLEHLYEMTDPRYLQGEPDTYWIQYGGGDPVRWCHRLKGRLPIIHLKDYAVMPDNKTITHAEIGNGNLDWKAIIPAAEAAGCQWFAVEQDTCPGDPFDSVKQSFDYIKENLCSK